MKLSDYSSEWMFTDSAIPVSSSDWERISPLGEEESSRVWMKRISRTADHPMRLSEDDQSRLFKEKKERTEWQTAWNSNSNNLPTQLEEIEWNADTEVYFAYSCSNIIQTQWSVFKRNWKCFLFEDEGPLLFSLENEMIVSFGPDGYLTIYSKSQPVEM